MKTKSFGYLPDGREITLYTLENKNGMEAVFSDLGGTLVSLYVPDRNGVKRNVVLGYDTLEEYLQDQSFFGVNVGRHANRIAGAAFELNGRSYQMDANDNENNLHSGADFWNKRKWRAYMEKDEELGETITFYMTSEDGDQGMPGECYAEMTFSLTDENELYVEYYGTSDQDTIFNMTNHSYFNLNGAESGDILKHRLYVVADSWTPTNEKLIPTGEIASVAGTPLDFTEEKEIGQDIEADFAPLAYGNGGYDQNLVVNGGEVLDAAALVARLTGDQSGITMEVYTDRPCMQIYTANWKDDTKAGRDGATYRNHQGVCLETQFAPDGIHHEEFASPVLKAGEESAAQTVFHFLV